MAMKWSPKLWQMLIEMQNGMTFEMQQIIEISVMFFLFWVTEIECRPRADGEEFQKTKRVFCS